MNHLCRCLKVCFELNLDVLTWTFQTTANVHTRHCEVDAKLQLSSAVALIETQTSIHPEVTPVQPPAFQH